MKFTSLFLFALIALFGLTLAAAQSIPEPDPSPSPSPTPHSSSDLTPSSNIPGIQEDGEDHVSEREVQVGSFAADRVEFQAQTKAGNIQDEIQIQMRASSEGVRVQFEYSSEVGSVESELKFKMRAFRLVEFTGTEFFNESSTIVQYYPLSKFADMVAPVVTPNMTIATLVTKDGVFKTVAYLTTTDITQVGGDGITNVTYSPNSMKVDFIITNFPYNVSNSKLALEMRVATSSEVEEHDNADEDAKVVTMGNPNTDSVVGLFDWAGNAYAGSSAIAVHSSPLRPVVPTTPVVVPVQGEHGEQHEEHEDSELDTEAGEMENVFAFTFMTTSQPNQIIWDPEIGVAYNTVSSGFALSSSTLLSALLFAVVAVVQRF